jgi:DnaJ-class molecular chaperone
VAADDAPEDQPEGGERPCPPCRATGKVVSNLGGTPSAVDCPWCDGTGRLSRDHDAQARWRSGA